MTTGHQASQLPAGKIRFYAKLVLLIIVGLYLLSFCLINFAHQTQVWLLPGLELETRVLWVILLTAGLTLLARYLVKWVNASMGQMRRNRSQ